MSDAGYKDEEKLQELYIERDLTYDEVADEFDVASTTIQYWVGKFGLNKDRSEIFRQDKPPVSEDTLREMYWDDMMSQSDIARELGFEQASISNYMNFYDIEARGPGGSPTPPAPKELIEELYVDREWGSRRVAGEIGCTRNTVRRWLDRWGIEKHPSGQAKRDLVDDNKLIRLYKDEGLTQEQIAADLDVDVSQTTVGKWLNDLSVDTECNGGWGEFCTTENGERVKSALEKQVADWLFEHNIEYEYEPNITGTLYVPDFMVDGDLIEVWGVRQLDRYDDRRESKVSEYRSLGYNVISIDPPITSGKTIGSALESELL